MLFRSPISSRVSLPPSFRQNAPHRIGRHKRVAIQQSIDQAQLASSRTPHDRDQELRVRLELLRQLLELFLPVVEPASPVLRPVLLLKQQSKVRCDARSLLDPSFGRVRP